MAFINRWRVVFRDHTIVGRYRPNPVGYEAVIDGEPDFFETLNDFFERGFWIDLD